MILTFPHYSDLLNVELLLTTPHLQLQSIGRTPTIHNRLIHGQFRNHQLDQNEKTCILATLSIPSNLGSSSSTNQPSSVNLGGWVLDIRFVDWLIISVDNLGGSCYGSWSSFWLVHCSIQKPWHPTRQILSFHFYCFTFQNLGTHPGCSRVATLWRRSERRATRSIPCKDFLKTVLSFLFYFDFFI